MKCGVILVGSELLNGMMADTNSLFIAEELNKYGIEMNFKMAVGDKIDDIIFAIDTAKKRCGLVIISGGLGPTIDDITRDGVAKYLGRELVLYEEEFTKIKNKFDAMKLEMPERNVRQAVFPKDSVIIENKKGAAPSFFIDEIAVFPGVPEELRDCFPRFMEYYAREKGIETRLYIKDLIVWGLPESEIEKRILDLVEDTGDVFIEFLVKNYGILIRFLCDISKAHKVNAIKSRIYERIGEYIFGEDGDRLENIVYDEVKKRGYKISVAESCTGGMISTALTNVSGISEIFTEGMVTYANESKIKRLGVKPGTIEKYGAVSKETVDEMLLGLDTEIGIAVSGIAGPTGGSAEKPVGTVFIGIKINEKRLVESHMVRGDRDKIRRRTVLTALDMLRKEFIKNKGI